MKVKHSSPACRTGRTPPRRRGGKGRQDSHHGAMSHVDHSRSGDSTDTDGGHLTRTQITTTTTSMLASGWSVPGAGMGRATRRGKGPTTLSGWSIELSPLGAGWAGVRRLGRESLRGSECGASDPMGGRPVDICAMFDAEVLATGKGWTSCSATASSRVHVEGRRRRGRRGRVDCSRESVRRQSEVLKDSAAAQADRDGGGTASMTTSNICREHRQDREPSPNMDLTRSARSTCERHGQPQDR